MFPNISSSFFFLSMQRSVENLIFRQHRVGQPVGLGSGLDHHWVADADIWPNYICLFVFFVVFFSE